MAKGPTVYDVAEQAGVSIATVSFAFRRPEKVKASTWEMVLAVAREMGYVPSASARGLAHGRTRAIGLFSFDYLLDSPERRPATDASAPNTKVAPGDLDPNEVRSEDRVRRTAAPRPVGSCLGAVLGGDRE